MGAAAPGCGSGSVGGCQQCWEYQPCRSIWAKGLEKTPELPPCPCPFIWGCLGLQSQNWGGQGWGGLGVLSALMVLGGTGQG